VVDPIADFYTANPEVVTLLIVAGGWDLDAYKRRIRDLLEHGLLTPARPDLHPPD
jgi:hypothetical protein